MRKLIPVVQTCGLVLIMVGCATAPPPAAAPVATPASTAPVAAAPAAPAPTTHVVPVSQLTAEEIVGLKRLGYKLVDSNGETLYCSTDIKLGSRLQHDNVCMTEREMIALREETQRRLQYITTQIPPPSGK